jgi:putative hydrolase of HD superfamily
MSNEDAASIVGFGYELGHLKQTQRAGWLLAGVRNPESVAEHSFRVACLAYFIAVCEGANADRAVALGLFHDVPETRIGDIASVGKRYVETTSPHAVISDQTAELLPDLRKKIVALLDEHESAKTASATPESLCSRDADKIECILQAREYQREGYTQLQPWIDTMVVAVTTETGKRLAQVAQEVSPAVWWDKFAASFGA